MSKNIRSTLQFRQVMNDRARRGERLTDEEIEEISRETRDLAGTTESGLSCPQPLIKSTMTSSNSSKQAQQRTLSKPNGQIAPEKSFRNPQTG